MAWRSSGSTNEELIDNLKQNGIISSPSVEKGFRAVDRRFFVPKGQDNAAYVDQPLRGGNVHLSAPHIYGSALEALELRPNSATSFLNVGSGSGYLTCVVAAILGSSAACHGVEIKRDVVKHAEEAVQRWRETYDERLPQMQNVHGNALTMNSTKGECALGFDRIYIGAAIDRSHLSKLTRLLRPGGILVGPADDEMVKIFRLRKTEGNDGDVDSDDFSQQLISGVRFAPLLTYPRMPTIIHATVWEPALHQSYPDSFQKASKTILMCGGSDPIQPEPKPRDRRNVAAMLPPAIWMEILSFTHRHWFEPSETDEGFLRQRLAEEQETSRRAQQARLEAEARCQRMERERDLFRLMARRWQGRMHALMQERRREGASEAARRIEDDILLGGREETLIFGLGTMLGGFHTDSDDDDDDDDDHHNDQDEDDDISDHDAGEEADEGDDGEEVDDDDEEEEETGIDADGDHDIRDELDESDGEMDAEDTMSQQDIGEQPNEVSMASNDNGVADRVPFDTESVDDDYEIDSENSSGSESSGGVILSVTGAGIQSSGKQIMVRPQIRTVSMSSDEL